MSSLLPHVVGSLMLAVTVTSVAAAQNKTQAVHFAHGMTSANVTGRITGERMITYALGVKGGQSAKVSMKADTGDCTFLVFQPGQTPDRGQAFFNGNTGGNDFTGVMPSDGTYLVQVGMGRDPERREKTCSYTIAFGIA